MNSKKTFFLIGIILLSLFCIIYLQQNINRIRGEDFIGTNAVLNDVPPGIAFATVALGGFRGIVADILWLKTISLQEEGKYFEMAQLALWILKLQPKSTGAISFLAWNMAYNISVIYAEPEKKWQWVENGINLLRNAIRYNPGNALLCKELSWIYINKIGDKYDSANLYYKTKLALNMEKITGSNPVENENFWILAAQIPLDYKEFIKKYSLGSSISEILENSEYKNIEDLYAVFKKEGNLPRQFESKFTDRKLLLSLILYLKKRMLKEEFGLDAERIVEINKKFGDLDWRLYSSLALYWSYVGLTITKDSRECRTALNMALAATVLNGKLLFINDSNYEDFMTIPNFTVFPIINNYFIDKIAGWNRDDYANFYFGFAGKIIPVLHLYGNFEQAKIMFDNLKNTYSADMSGIETLQMFLDLYWSNYLEKNNKEQILKDISQYIDISYLLKKKGMMKFAENLEGNSKYIYDRYSRYYFNNTLPEFQTFYTQRMGILREKY